MRFIPPQEPAASIAVRTVREYLPFERIAARYRRTHLVRMNRDYPESELLKERFLPFTEDISMIFKRLTL
jgi:hypothetical protein